MPPQNQCKVKGVVISDLQKQFWKADVESIRRDLGAILDVARSVSVQASLKTGILASMSVLAHPVMDEFLAQPESGYDKRAKQFCGMPDWNVWVSEISDILAQPDCGLTIETILGDCGGVHGCGGMPKGGERIPTRRSSRTGAAVKQERILTRDTTSSNGTFQPTLCDQQQLQNMVVRQLRKNVIQAEQDEETAKTGAAVKQERIPTRRSSQTGAAVKHVPRSGEVLTDEERQRCAERQRCVEEEEEEEEEERDSAILRNAAAVTASAPSSDEAFTDEGVYQRLSDEGVYKRAKKEPPAPGGIKPAYCCTKHGAT